jgi:hypothetical protein
MTIIENKYSRWYFNIIKNAIQESRQKIKFELEKHHIIPKSLGGTNKKDNLVLLTHKEHFICHLLLTKFTEKQEKVKMNLAWYKMANVKRYNSRKYQFYRKKMIECISGENNPFYGKTHTKEVREKLKIANLNSGTNKGVPKSEEHKRKLSEHFKGKKNPKVAEALRGRKLSAETKEKISKAGKGRKFSPEAIEKIRNASLAQWARYREQKESNKYQTMNKTITEVQSWA